MWAGKSDIRLSFDVIPHALWLPEHGIKDVSSVIQIAILTVYAPVWGLLQENRFGHSETRRHLVQVIIRNDSF